MFENKVNTSKKRTKLACLNDRKNYLQNFKISVSSNKQTWKSDPLRYALQKVPLNYTLISDPVREVVRPVLYKLYPRGAILQVLFFQLDTIGLNR